MLRRVFGLLGLYLLLAAGTWAAEAAGIGGKRFRCGCSASCWCKRPGLALFRWVTPGSWHQIGLSPNEKRAAAGA